MNVKTPYELFGVECGPGWRNIIEPLLEQVQKYNEQHPDDCIEVLQVKEKFGGLRFYVSRAPEELRNAINEAEDLSYHICEECGTSEDVVHTVGWVYTRCRKCLKKLERPYGPELVILEDTPPHELP